MPEIQVHPYVAPEPALTARAPSRHLFDHYLGFLAAHARDAESKEEITEEVFPGETLADLLLFVSRNEKMHKKNCIVLVRRIMGMTRKKIKYSEGFHLLARALGYPLWGASEGSMWDDQGYVSRLSQTSTGTAQNAMTTTLSVYTHPNVQAFDYTTVQQAIDRLNAQWWVEGQAPAMIRLMSQVSLSRLRDIPEWFETHRKLFSTRQLFTKRVRGLNNSWTRRAHDPEEKIFYGLYHVVFERLHGQSKGVLLLTKFGDDDVRALLLRAPSLYPGEQAERVLDEAGEPLISIQQSIPGHFWHAAWHG